MRRHLYLMTASLVALALIGGSTLLLQQTRNSTGSQSSARSSDSPTESAGHAMASQEGRPHGKPGRAYSLQPEDRIAIPPGHAEQVVATLRPAAEAGDAKAAMTLYLKLTECDQAIRNPVSEGELEAYRRMGAEKALLEGQLERLAECGSVNQLLADRGHWLEQAADAGLLEAQLLYAASPNAVVGNSSAMIAEPRKAERFKAKAVQYLTRRAAEGNIDSIMRLASSYNDGILLKQDHALSYAYYRVVDRARPGLLPVAFISSSRNRVSPNKRREAEEFARQFYRQCCDH